MKLCLIVPVLLAGCSARIDGEVILGDAAVVDGATADTGSPVHGDARDDDARPPESAVLVGAGDIADCEPGADATADLLDTIDGTIFLAGDNAYPYGTAADYSECFDPTWGRHKARIKPAPGNHEYAGSPSASGYFGYFGDAAGEAGKGYYSYDYGAWHVVVLNTNDGGCDYVQCDAGSAQEEWLRADLADHPTACTVAYFHHPRWSSGEHGSQAFVEDLWRALYDGGVDLVLNGHDHHYERFAPQNEIGQPDPAGIRQFVVGTGGRSHYAIGDVEPNSEVRDGDTYGVLKLTLHPTGYDWEFVPVVGETFTDSGRAECH